MYTGVTMKQRHLNAAKHILNSLLTCVQHGWRDFKQKHYYMYIIYYEYKSCDFLTVQSKYSDLRRMHLPFRENCHWPI